MSSVTISQNCASIEITVQTCFQTSGNSNQGGTNLPPMATDDFVITDFETAFTFNPSLNDSDPDDTTLIVTSLTQPANATATLNADSTITFVPDANFSGDTSFSYTLSDNRGGTDTATINVTVNAQMQPSNNPPVATNDAITTNFDQPVTFDPRENDNDPDGDDLTIVFVTQPSNGTVAINNGQSITFTPEAGFSGQANFTYTIRDAANATNTASVTVTVAAQIEYHVFVLAGQSNMVGRAPFDNGELFPADTLQYGREGADDRVLIPATSPLQHHNPQPGDAGPAVQFSIDYKAVNPNAILVLVPCAMGGSSFVANDWNPGDPLYNDLVSRTNELMAANPDYQLKGVLWHQGENDAGNAAYQDQLDAMIQQLRTDISTADITTPIILGELLPSWVDENPAREATNTIILDTPDRLEKTYVVSARMPSTLTGLPDGIHFDSASTRQLGSRYFEIYNNPPVASVPDSPVNLVAIPDDMQVELTWERPAANGDPITDYLIEVSTLGSTFTALNDGQGTNLTFTHSGLTNNQEYIYRIAAINAAGTGSFSQPVNAIPAAASDPNLEPGALGHWLLGEDNPGHADLLSAQSLLENGATPNADTGYITPQAGVGQGLLAPIADMATITCIFVLRKTLAGNGIIGGTLMTGGGGHGWSAFHASSSLFFNERNGAAANVVIEQSFINDEFIFLASSLSANGDWVLFRGDGASSVVQSGTGTRNFASPALNIALGNVHYNNGGFATPNDYAEMIVFDTAKTESELQEIYDRSKSRLATRGISVR